LGQHFHQSPCSQKKYLDDLEMLVKYHLAS
jgi:hypothetical protein